MKLSFTCVKIARESASESSVALKEVMMVICTRSELTECELYFFPFSTNVTNVGV